MALPLRFHWHPLTESLLEADKLTAVSQHAEKCGFESVVVQIPLASETFRTTVAAAGKATQKIKFLVRYEADQVPKRNFPKQISLVVELLAGRVAIYLPFDQNGRPLCEEDTKAEEYYSSICEFLCECRALPEPRPEIFVEGVSAEAEELAIKFADCLWLKPKRPEQIYSDALPVLHMGKEVGLRTELITRETTEEAHAVAADLFPDGRSKVGNTSEGGVCLWAGTPSQQCSAEIVLAGSFAEVAGALMRYKEKGVSQFLFSGQPEQQVMTHFAAGILPLVRRLEANGNHE